MAQAEEATAPQYTPEVPAVPNEERTPQKGGGIGGSNNGGGKAGASESPDGAVGGGNGGSGSGGGTDTGQSSQASGKDGSGKDAGGGAATGKISNTEALPTQSAANTSAESDDSSSPLVPILIAVAILAAISIGAYYYRQRRQDPDSPVSPKAS